MAAAGLADVGAADAEPGVLGGCGKHVGEELAIGLLDEGALGESALRVGDAAGERGAHFLERAEAEHAGLSGGLDRVRDVAPAESLDDKARQLTLEPPDLAAQLGPRKSLV